MESFDDKFDLVPRLRCTLLSKETLSDAESFRARFMSRTLEVG